MANNATLGQLIKELKARRDEVAQGPNGDKKPLLAHLFLAFTDANEEIRMGADFDAFVDIAMLNLILRGAEDGYSNDEIHGFVRKLQEDLL